MSKLNLNKANAGSYRLVFPKIPTSNDMNILDEFTLNIHSTVIPSLTLANTEMAWQGAQIPLAIAPVTFEPWYLNFTVDSNYHNWMVLYDWITFFNNNEDQYDQKPSDFWVDASLQLFDNFGKEVMTVVIENIFPTMLGEVTLDYRDKSTNLESSVSFNYTKYRVVRN